LSTPESNDVERLLAYEEIRQLASRYSIYLDARDIDKLVGLFVDDVRVGRDSYGREALKADFDASLRDVGVTFLLIGNHAIEFADADHATGIVYCRGEIQDGGPESDDWIIHAIQYHDAYERRAGHWFFVRRKHFLVYGAPLGTNPLTLAPANWPASQTGMGSHPQALQSWQSFWSKEEA
jgi:hypothetical protein